LYIDEKALRKKFKEFAEVMGLPFQYAHLEPEAGKLDLEVKINFLPNVTAYRLLFYVEDEKGGVYATFPFGETHRPRGEMWRSLDFAIRAVQVKDR